jgi:Fe-S cluster assembly protein SufB
MQSNSKTIDVTNTWNFKNNINYSNKIIKGINTEVIKQISIFNNEPNWLLEFRLKSFKKFNEKKLPSW